MAFIAELEDQIQSIYSKILKKKYQGVPGKTPGPAHIKRSKGDKRKGR